MVGTHVYVRTYVCMHLCSEEHDDVVARTYPCEIEAVSSGWDTCVRTYVCTHLCSEEHDDVVAWTCHGRTRVRLTYVRVWHVTRSDD